MTTVADSIVARLPHWHSLVAIAATLASLVAIALFFHRIAALRGDSRWNVSDLFTDPTTGRLDPRHYCYVVGSVALTFGFLKMTWSAMISDGVVTFFVAYGAMMMFPQFAERVLLARFGVASGPTGPNGTPKAPDETAKPRAGAS